MITASGALSAAQAEDYYRREYTRDGFYIGDRETGAGTWQGRGAERLGLAGEVAPEDFAALLGGRSPRDGRQLVATQTTCGKRRAGWDFQASPDKTVSIAGLVGGDERIVAAHLAAARRAFEVLEERALVRSRHTEGVPTRNLVYARFDHDASRALDPHLHSHHLIFNLTERAARDGGGWRSLESRGLFIAQRLATAVYHAELARRLQALGYEVHADARGLVGIAGIPEPVVKTFSKRRLQILAEVERRGRWGPADRRRAALYTRPKKNRDVDPTALRVAWRAEAARQGLDLDGLRRAAGERLRSGNLLPAGDAHLQARAAVAWAVGQLAERRASFRPLDLEVATLRRVAARGPGLDEVRTALAAHRGLIRDRDGRLTTEAALRLELASLSRVRAGLLPSARPILSRPYPPGPVPTLGAGQLWGIRHILASRQQVVGIEAEAGAGKTSLFAAVREAAEKAGWTVRIFAVSASAVAQLRAAGLEAATLASLAAHPPTEKLPRQLWIVARAKVLSNRDAATTLESAHRAGARLVLVGDRRQRYAVAPGTPWAAFQTAGLRPARLDFIRPREHGDRGVDREQGRFTFSRASHQLAASIHDRAALARAFDRETAETTAREAHLPRSRSHAPSPPHRASPGRTGDRPGRRPGARLAGTVQAEPAAGRSAASRTGADAGRGAASPAGAGVGRDAASPTGAAAEPGPAPHRRPRARPGGRADRALGARDPRPRPHPLREPRPQPRPQRAPERPRGAVHPADRASPLLRGVRPRDPGDLGRDRPALHRSRPLTDPLARRVIHAAERWQQAARLPPGGELERRLVRLLEEIGVRRGLALLPAALAQAVRGIQEVGRLVAGLALDR